MSKVNKMPGSKTLTIVVVLLAVAASTPASGQEAMHWHSSLEEAMPAAVASNRLILIHFWAPWCKDCVKLESDVFSQPQVQQALQSRFVLLKLNADDYPRTVQQYGVDRLPTDLIITPAGQIVGRMRSPLAPEDYVQQLNIAASGALAQQQATAPATAAGAVAGNAPGAPFAAAPQPAMTQQPIAAQQPPMARQPATPAQPAAVPAYSGQRYAEYFQRFQPATPPANVQAATTASPPSVSAPVASTQGMAIASSSSAAMQAPVFSQPVQSNPQLSQPIASTPFGPPQIEPGRAVAGPPAAIGAPQPPVPLGLEGYCPVTLAEQKRWQVGDRRWGVVHRGRTYVFSGPEEQKAFLANPDRYSPAISGHDVVLALDQAQRVEGQRQFGVEYRSRVYLFSSPATRDAFSQNPGRYAAEVLQAESPQTSILR